jgi:DNA-binding transcriptional regulator YhcF (GntR family)/AcrR family transcriptional regulator
MTSGAAGPVYLVIADEIVGRIRKGDLKPGDRVPSTRQITRDWGVAMATATKVLAELRSRGAVLVRPGAGSVVASDPSLRPAPARRPAAPPPPARARSVHSGAGTATRDRIISSAIAIADAEGVAVVSLRRIAVNLDVSTMSLYRRIANKEDLLVGMMDALMGAEAWPTPPPRGWRAQLEYIAHRQWRGYQSHPWLAQIVSLTRPQLAPNAMRHTEWSLRAIDGCGLDDTTRLYIVLTLFGHVRGAATGLESEQQAERDTGIDIEEWMRVHDARFAPVIQSGRFPHLAKLDNNADVDFDLDALFEFGLARLLDGFAALIEGRQRGRALDG